VDKHIEKMENLLESFKHYVVKPNKVIVSLSPRYLKLDLYNEKERLEQKFPFLLCLVQEKITGIGENINYTFNHVTTDYVTIWGADDFFHPQYFEVMNYIIKKYNSNILVHSFVRESHNINSFNKIQLENIKIYNDFSLVYKGEEIYRFCSKKYMDNYNNKGNEIDGMHGGMQTIKSNIVKETKFKEGCKYNWRSDSIFLSEIFKKYGNMIFIDEKMIQYSPSNTCDVIK
jgi:hypothetical protein